jgi:hypothetical protein
MSDSSTLEQRLARVERELARLKSQVRNLGAPKENWISQMRGRFKDDPVFDEIVRLGKEIRDSELPPDEDAQEQP